MNVALNVTFLVAATVSSVSFMLYQLEFIPVRENATVCDMLVFTFFITALPLPVLP